MDVLNNNKPHYIEDFRSEEPDWANNDNPTGDPDPEAGLLLEVDKF